MDIAPHADMTCDAAAALSHANGFAPAYIESG
jgi:hypothetical protein